MLAHQRLPTLCCRSQGHFIPKPKGDQRLIHALCAFGKDFMREVYSDSTRQPPGFSYGGYSRRRREGAILQQTALRERLRKAKISHLGRSYDIRNAFPSPSRDETVAKFLQHLLPSAAPFVHQRITEATTSLLAADGTCTVSHGSGGLQGDAVAGEVFSCVYEPVVARWHQAATDPPPRRSLSLYRRSRRRVSHRFR
jgi:hypothetical protein